MEIKVADFTEIHKFIEKYPGTKSVVWENDVNSNLVLAVEHDVIIGFAFIFKRLIPAPIGDINEIFINVIEVIEDKNRKKGIGSKIISQIKDIAKQKDVLQIRAYCDINNTSSHYLWLKNGFGISPVKQGDGSIVGSFVTYRFQLGRYTSNSRL